MRPALPARIKRQGRLLLNQQCWLWGQDVKHRQPGDEAENLLLRHGFTRMRPPAGVVGSSQYTLDLPDGLRVRLWGFGIFFGQAGGESGGLYLNRFDFFPRQAAPADQWQAHTLKHVPRARDLRLLPQLARWIGGYEAWVLQVAGAGYRGRCLDGWKRCAEPDQLPGLWHSLAADIESALGEAAAPPAQAGCRQGGRAG